MLTLILVQCCHCFWCTKLCIQLKLAEVFSTVQQQSLSMILPQGYTYIKCKNGKWVELNFEDTTIVGVAVMGTKVVGTGWGWQHLLMV